MVISAGILLLFGGRGLYHWSVSKEPGSVIYEARYYTQNLWRLTSELGTEAPALAAERAAREIFALDGKVESYQEVKEQRQLVLSSLSAKEPPVLARTFGNPLSSLESPLRPRVLLPEEAPSPVPLAPLPSPRKVAALPPLSDPSLFKKRQGMVFDMGDLKSEPKILILGDSLVRGVGKEIAMMIHKTEGGFATVHAKVSSGLARPDFFDWPTELHKNFVVGKYEVVVVLMGTNDAQSFRHLGKFYRFPSKKWDELYQERIVSFMDHACQGAKKVIWLGLPPMKSRSFDQKISHLNHLVEGAAKAKSCVDYVSLAPILGDGGGRYASFRKVYDRYRRVRLRDGIHLTRHGGRLVAEELIHSIKKIRVARSFESSAH